ncbi:hypothetical protein SAMN04488104_101953 [Algoriphagus faecimaris]|uniref:Uncharacterized protein n=1 Tax=Algoriphagus faecimaris TaxID=686796 RepID=A0A1G6T023_9BACT|nr:hypothetical protein [Algoriphagus faecimaris]SDD21705.1 hypothetical protein SAMN04488104_101953 [Algoriphagus faecimaris]
MNTSIFTQKNICAALGLAMAMTIVIKAKTEANLAHNTARFETTKPTPQIGLESENGPDILQVNILKNEKPRVSGTS